MTPNDGNAIRDDDSTWSRWLLRLAFVYAIAVSAIGFRHSLLDMSGHRQTQTALSAEYLTHTWPNLAYDTPMCGPPWPIPLELPLYQHIVALLTWVGPLPLEQAGRLVGIAFHLACMIPLAGLGRRLGIGLEGRRVLLALFLMSPLLLYWSRCFLIESTSLFFSLVFLAAGARQLESSGMFHGIVCIVAGAIAGMVKVTTFCGFLPALVLLALARKLHGQCVGYRVLAAELALPLIAVLLWTNYADHLKSMNPLGHYFTSGELMEWNFGTLSQRLDSTTWRRILLYASLAVGHRHVLAVCVAAGLVLTRRRMQILACVFLSGIPPLVFTNLFAIHEYYAYENTLFLVAAVALAFIGMLERPGVVRLLGIGALGGTLSVFVAAAYLKTIPRQWTDRPFPVAVLRAIEQHTQSEELLIIAEGGWNPEILYYSRRRGLVLPWNEDRVPDEALEESLRRVAELQVGAVVLVPSTRTARGDRIVSKIFDRFPDLRDEVYRDDVYVIHARTGGLGRPAP